MTTPRMRNWRVGKPDGAGQNMALPHKKEWRAQTPRLETSEGEASSSCGVEVRRLAKSCPGLCKALAADLLGVLIERPARRWRGFVGDKKQFWLGDL